jgi:hypothetical protein
MSAHHEELNLTPEEKRYRACMTTGDDFIRIEIFRSAEAWFKRALDVKPGDKEASGKLAETREKIKRENKAIYAIVAVLAVVVLLVVILV